MQSKKMLYLFLLLMVVGVICLLGIKRGVSPVNNLEKVVRHGVKILDYEDPMKHIEREYGKPITVNQEVMEFYKLPRHVYVYNGLKISIVEDEGRTKSLIEKVEITSNEYKIPLNLKIGSTKEEILFVMNTPNVQEDELFKYYYKMPVSGYIWDLEILFKNNKAIKYLWTPPID